MIICRSSVNTVAEVGENSPSGKLVVIFSRLVPVFTSSDGKLSGSVHASAL